MRRYQTTVTLSTDRRLVEHAGIEVASEYERCIVSAGIRDAVLATAALINNAVAHVLDVVACIQDFV